MGKVLFLISIASLFLGGCGLNINKAGIELISQPSAKVFIDGKEAGMTPYENKSLTAGEVTVKMVTDDNSTWEKKIKLTTNASTVVDWKIKKENDSGYVINVERTGDKEKSGIIINTNPSEAAVMIDGTVVGYSPLRADDIGIGDKQISISFPGYQTQTIFVKGWPGLRLVIEARLAKSEFALTVSPTPTPSSLAPGLSVKKVRILNTETGFLRVRSEASSGSSEIGRVNPQEVYPLLEEKTDWWKIDLGNDKSGWISAKYAELSAE
ncbi:MAG: PEGA domain-containing protein [Candidatus Shapirobacteria bacterium]